jgi:VIT1/CCC1 family predicted Fe2+/Mn2+ transporter
MTTITQLPSRALHRASREAEGAAEASRPRLRHEPKANWLRDVILGGQDGLVNILGITLGVIAVGGTRTVLLAAGFAAAITESISMGAVGYTSTMADRDYYNAALRREQAEIASLPDAERDAIRQMYAAKGIQRRIARQRGRHHHGEPRRMARHRHGRRTAPAAGRNPRRAAQLGGHHRGHARRTSHSTAAISVAGSHTSGHRRDHVVRGVLFVDGAYSAITLVSNWRRGGLKMIVIGLGAAAIGFAIGLAFQ